MKELSIIEKAKAYDEVIKKAETLYKAFEPMSGCNVLLETLFHGLKESEDERIRKWLIYYFKEVCDNVSEKEKKGVLAWLEKQDEQKPAIFIPKFRIGNKLVSTKNPRLTYEVLEVGHINELGNPEYKVEIFTDGKASNPHNIHDMECYKVDEWAKLIEQKPVGFNIGDEITVNGQVCRVVAVDKDAWSEEDDGHIHNIIGFLEECKSYNPTPENTRVANFEINWLKSLRPQNRQKPSKEMLKALYRAVPENVMEISEDEMLLDKLYQGLKYGRVLSKN